MLHSLLKPVSSTRRRAASILSALGMRQPPMHQPQSSKTPLLQSGLDDFVARVDRIGGPASPDFYARFGNLEYVPSVRIDQSLDPYSSEYFDMMYSLYEEISGKGYAAAQSELTDFQIDGYIPALVAYGPIEPSSIATHLHRLSSAIRFAGLPRGSAVLDMGCGWGFSSELLAQCGYEVTAVDINPKFVELVRARTRRLGYNVEVVGSTFEEFTSEAKFHGVLFYECLHHATKPWKVIENIQNTMTPGGKMILVGEPIQDLYWRHWGLRLDPLSVYCIRKFGWFESGWSMDFLLDMFARRGMLARVKTDPDPVVGPIVCAEIVRSSYAAADYWSDVASGEWTVEGTTLISSGSSRLKIVRPHSCRAAVLTILNNRGKVIPITIRSVSEIVYSGRLTPGENRVELQIPPGIAEFAIDAESWSPAVEQKSTDARTMSFHLTKVEFIS